MSDFAAFALGFTIIAIVLGIVAGFVSIATLYQLPQPTIVLGFATGIFVFVFAAAAAIVMRVYGP